MSPKQQSSTFGEEYYRHGFGPIPYERNDHWLSFFNRVADELIRTVRPHRVFDAGCAMGFLVESFRDRGVDAWGADISDYAINNVRTDVRPFCRVGSITEPLAEHYDLITCIEVIEHIPESNVRVGIQRLTEAADTIFFSSTPDDFDEPTHVSVQLPVYWLKLFAEFGFWPDIYYDGTFLTPHAFLVRRGGKVLSDDVIALFGEKLRLHASLLREYWRPAAETADFESSKPNVKAIRQDQLDRVIESLSDAEISANIGKLREARLLLTRLAGKGAEPSDSETMLEPRAVLQRRHDRLALDFDRVRRELEIIYHSPGWKAVAGYRAVLDGLRSRHPKVWNRYESVATKILSHMGLLRRTASVLDEVPAESGGTITSTAQYTKWTARVAVTESQLKLQRSIAGTLARTPVISLVVPFYKVPLPVARATVESVVAQTYGRWQLCVTHGDPESHEVRRYLAQMAEADSRINFRALDTNLGISGNSNAGLDLASGEYLALLDHDDVLAPQALFEIAAAVNDRPEVDLWYSDKDQIDEAGVQPLDPLFKPDWSPEMMLSVNYLTHLTVARTQAVRTIGGWRMETDGAQDWDLFLRLFAGGARVARIPKVLYHWRRISTSVASGGMEAKPYAKEAQLKSLRDYFAAAGWRCDVTFSSGAWLRLLWPKHLGGMVSVILVHRLSDFDAIEAASRLAHRIGHESFEVVVPVTRTASARSDKVRVVKTTPRASLARKLNETVGQCRGDRLVFVDENMSIEDENWVTELAAPLAQPGVGISGPNIIDRRTRLLRHAGILFNEEFQLEYPFAGDAEGSCNEFGSASWYRNWLAVSGACFAVRRDVWEKVGGFADGPRYPRLDVDFCLRVISETRQRVMTNPHAHIAQSGIAALEEWTDPFGPESGKNYIRACYPEGDPYFNPNLSCRSGRIGLRFPAVGGSAPASHDFQAEARFLVSKFDFSDTAVAKSKAARKSRTGRVESVAWFIPEFVNPFYGGIHTILRFADYFQRAHGVSSRFIVETQIVPSILQGRIARAFPELARSSELIAVDDRYQVNDCSAVDAAVATLWTTAYPLLRFERTRQKFYFLQDNETLFYPAGSTNALVHATYGFGYIGLCNTVTLRDQYRALGGEAEFFDPCIDPRVFHPNSRASGLSSGPNLLFCYARPGHPRNCFELLIAAMRIVKKELGDRVRILTAGADWEPDQFGLGDIVENLGVLSYANTGALYRACDAGVALMMTSHPSYLPFELMACGALAIANRNPQTDWFLRDRENCLLADASSSCLADTVMEGIRNQSLRETITRNAAALIEDRYSDWDRQAEKIYRYMCSHS